MFQSQVKEKEQARKEYKQAIQQGDGAYLMDQDAPVTHSNRTPSHQPCLPWGPEDMMRPDDLLLVDH